MENKKILVSGVKPTGRPHIGNYFGAIKQFVDLQNGYDSFIFVAEYHALTSERLYCCWYRPTKNRFI
jgi:tryptophanyl-tRNA synthetase